MGKLRCAFFLLLSGILCCSLNDVQAQVGKSSVIRTVVIDAGHGGKDRGCKGSHVKEKDMTLKLALAFGKQIEAGFPDIKVVYTRTTDVFIPLDERADIANKEAADLFISIHCNAHNSSVSGTETFVMGLHKAKENLEVAKRENASIYLEEDYEIKYQGFDPESNEGHIWLTMVQNMYLAQSISLADKIEKEFQKIAGRKSRGVKQAGFVVLRLTAMPSVLVEAGFLSNIDEERFLSSPEGKNQMASALFSAFTQYKKEMDRIADPVLDPKPAPKKEMAIKAQKAPENTATQGSLNEQRVKEKDLVNAGPSQEIWMAEPLQRPPLEAIEYRVQLSASITPLDTKSGAWKRVENLQEVWEKNRYKYLITGFPSFQDAMKGLNYWQEHGFPDAFVVAYRNGKRVNLSDSGKP